VEGEIQLIPHGTAATNRPIVPTPDDYYDGQFGGMIDRGNRSTGENLPQYHFLHHKSHMLCPGANQGRRGRKPETNRLSYGTAIIIQINQNFFIFNVTLLSQFWLLYSVILKQKAIIFRENWYFCLFRIYM
jgi:hypothetical protein